MKEAWQTVKMNRRRSGEASLHLIPLLILLLIPSSINSATPYPSVYIPIGVGYASDYAQLKEFGMFNAALTTCGKLTITAISPEYNNTSTDTLVPCEPRPDRVIVTDAVHDYGTFPRSMKDECELLTCSADSYPSAGTDLGAISNGASGDTAISGKPENSETNVCGAKMAKYSNGATGAILFANEGQCYKTYNNLQTKLEPTNAKFKQVPRWLKPGEKTLDKRSFYFDGEGTNTVHNFPVPYVFEPITSMNNLNYQECLTACDSGKVVKLQMKPSAYRTMIYLSGDCPAFKICLDPNDMKVDSVVPTCKPNYDITVLVDNGVIIWPGNHRSSVFEMKAPGHQSAHFVPIEFGFNKFAEFYFTNVHRETVSTDSSSTADKTGQSGYAATAAHNLAIFFPKMDCLKASAGIFSEYIDSGKVLTTQPVTRGSNYGPTLERYKNDSVVAIAEPPKKEVNEAIPSSTTPAPIVVVPGSVHLAVSDQLDSNLGSAAAYIAGKWWTWGIYIGFVIGTLLSLGVGGGIFYLLRRTVFGVWYRGMFKRYGCDVSGTTGGITGVGFGNTMTGDMTVQGTTAAGTTAAGTTGMGSTSTSSSVIEKTERTGTSTLAL